MPEVGEDPAGRVVAGRAGDPASGVSAGAAQVQPATGVAYRAQPGTGRMWKSWSGLMSPWKMLPSVRP